MRRTAGCWASDGCARPGAAPPIWSRPTQGSALASSKALTAEMRSCGTRDRRAARDRGATAPRGCRRPMQCLRLKWSRTGDRCWRASGSRAAPATVACGRARRDPDQQARGARGRCPDAPRWRRRAAPRARVRQDAPPHPPGPKPGSLPGRPGDAKTCREPARAASDLRSSGHAAPAGWVPRKAWSCPASARTRHVDYRLSGLGRASPHRNPPRPGRTMMRDSVTPARSAAAFAAAQSDRAGRPARASRLQDGDRPARHGRRRDRVEDHVEAGPLRVTSSAR